MNKEEILSTIKESELNMKDVLDIAKVLVVEELSTPRIQLSTDIRNEEIANIVRKWLSFYKPEVAMSILSEIALGFIAKEPSLREERKELGYDREYVF